MKPSPYTHLVLADICEREATEWRDKIGNPSLIISRTLVGLIATGLLTAFSPESLRSMLCFLNIVPMAYCALGLLAHNLYSHDIKDAKETLDS